MCCCAVVSILGVYLCAVLRRDSCVKAFDYKYSVCGKRESDRDLESEEMHMN